MVPAPRLSNLHRRKRARALTKPICLDTKPLQRRQPQVRQRYTFVVLGRAYNVPLVIHPAASEDHRQVSVAVA